MSGDDILLRFRLRNGREITGSKRYVHDINTRFKQQEKWEHEWEIENILDN